MPSEAAPTQATATQTTDTQQSTETTTAAETTSELGSEEATQSQETTEATASEGGTELTGGDESEGDKAEGEGDKPETSPYHGAPEGDYEAPTMPDGMALDQARYDAFVPVAKELGLSQAGLQKLIDFQAQAEMDSTQRWADTTNGWRDAAKADPEIGGAAYPETLKVARKAINEFGTSEFKKFLNDYGIGNHPEMIRFCRKVGAGMGEATAGAGAPAAQPLARHEKFYGPDPK